MTKSAAKTLFHIFILITAISVSAQNRQGNLVEYFGKEKVNDISEGSLKYIFNEGLILKIMSFETGSGTTPKNPVYAKFLLEDPKPVKAGEPFVEDEAGNTVSWQKIDAGENNEFTDNALRSGYLYLEYQADKEENIIFEASGHTMALINGFPHEGDHYDFGYSLIPVRLKKGLNTFVLQGGRFPRMRARLITPGNNIAFTKRDMTTPDILREEKANYLAAIRVMNVTTGWFTGGSITCTTGTKSASSPVPSVAPLYVRKVPFEIPCPENTDGDSATFTVTLKDGHGRTLHHEIFTLAVKSRYDHHKQTFLSNIDGSVQYYSIAPCSDKNIEHPALFFSTHGAGVEAVNQAHAYKKKDWGHLVAPTNRRPFGFAWEDWGRLDALEVFDHAQKLLKTDPQHTYLTGHSMGGHGAWYLGATYPDRWAAVAPCSGYPDLLAYRGNFLQRLENISDERLVRFGMSREQVAKILSANTLTDPKDILIDSILQRAGNPSRTLKLKRNYLHYGVYILHGELDTVVPTYIAREMRAILGSFHNDFAYYEYPGGAHWYGDQSEDWPPIFDFFKFREIKPSNEIGKIEFYTASPGVSSKSHFIEIQQQEIPMEISSFIFNRDSIPGIRTENAAAINIDLAEMGNTSSVINVDDQEIKIPDHTAMLSLTKNHDTWKVSPKPSPGQKGPQRNGGFKDAFRNNMVLVYGSKGSAAENEWWYHRALFDAEKFYYRANGNVELVMDTDFSPEKYPERNVILYGNENNNAAWKSLLSACPVRVENGKISIPGKSLNGNSFGLYFIYPRRDSDFASVGVVSATGEPGRKAAFANLYLENGTTFPDMIIVNSTVIKDGLAGIEGAGFFGNDWSVDNGDFVWR